MFRGKRLKLGGALLSGALGACAALRTPIVENDEYPFPEAMFATVASLASPAPNSDFSAALTLYKVALPGFTRPLPVWYWKQANAKFTFVLLSGYGGTPDSGTSQSVAEILWRAGFSVLSLPSSTHPDYSLAASATRLPGHIPRDLNELGQALDQIRAGLGAREPALLGTRWAMAGISYGALQTVLEARAETPHSHLGFEAFIAFNPPVRLSYSMLRLDQSFAEGSPRHLQKNGQLSRSLASKIDAAQKRRLFLSETLAAFDSHELEFLLAWDFRKSLLNAIAWKSADPRSLSFQDYLKAFLLPSLPAPRDFQSWADAQDLRNSSLSSASPSSFPNSLLVFHSLNDPLCTPDDILWLKRQLGPRMELYRQGGHLGYVWTDRFHADLGEILKQLH